MCLPASRLNVLILLQKKKICLICQLLTLSMDDFCHPVTQEKHNTQTTWHNWHQVRALSGYTHTPAFPNHISQLLLFWELTEIKGHTEHLYKALALSKGVVSWSWVQVHIIPKSRDSRLAQAALVECSTVLLTVHCEKPSWAHHLSCTSTSWPNLVVRNWEGRNPTKPPNQKSVLFFLPKFSRCHQTQTRRSSHIRWGVFHANLS